MDATGQCYSVSIPLLKAIDKHGDVILAYEMNGVPLSRDHGYPLRAIVPGIVGVRNCKWLSKVIVTQEESTGHWQKADYKGFSPNETWFTADFSKAAAIQNLPVISAVCYPASNDTVDVKDGHVTFKG